MHAIYIYIDNYKVTVKVCYVQLLVKILCHYHFGILLDRPPQKICKIDTRTVFALEKKTFLCVHCEEAYFLSSQHRYTSSISPEGNPSC